MFSIESFFGACAYDTDASIPESGIHQRRKSGAWIVCKNATSNMCVPAIRKRHEVFVARDTDCHLGQARGKPYDTSGARWQVGDSSASNQRRIRSLDRVKMQPRTCACRRYESDTRSLLPGTKTVTWDRHVANHMIQQEPDGKLGIHQRPIKTRMSMDTTPLASEPTCGRGASARLDTALDTR